MGPYFEEHLSALVAQFSLEFNMDAIVELCRVAKEVRIFPLLELGSAPSLHVTPVMDRLRHLRFRVKVDTVDCQFQRGGNQMMRIAR